MFYPYHIEENNGRFQCVVPDLKFYSEGDTPEESESIMKDSLTRYISDTFRKNGKPIPMPTEGDPSKDSLFYIDLKDSAWILLWNLLREKHMSTSELSRLLNVSRQQGQRLVDGSGTVSIDLYKKAFEALGYYLSLELNPYK